MKGLIMKDLYNISHNSKSMLFVLVVFAVAFIPTSGLEGYNIACAFLFGSMIVTTFSFDNFSNWAQYAMIMPVSRKELVAGKYAVLGIFCVIGSLFGLIISSIGRLVIGFGHAEIAELLLVALAALVISLISGGMSIPLVFKFGAEKARMLLVASVFIPAAVCLVIYRLLVMLGIKMTEKLVVILLCCSPMIALIWCYAMYRISYRIFEKQEL